MVDCISIYCFFNFVYDFRINVCEYKFDRSSLSYLSIGRLFYYFNLVIVIISFNVNLCLV